MSRNITINLDINKTNKKISFEAFEYEDINLTIALFDGKESYYLDNVNVELKYSKLTDNMDIKDFVAIKYDMNEVTGKIKFDEHSIYKLQLYIISRNNTLKSPLFFCNINKSLI